MTPALPDGLEQLSPWRDVEPGQAARLAALIGTDAQAVECWARDTDTGKRCCVMGWRRT